MALERVAFEIATVEGAAFGSLAKIASGGELARFSLALKVALAEASPPAALVFDEVDRGVGGAVADAVGERLQRLARDDAGAARHPFAAGGGARRAHFRITREKRQDQSARTVRGANASKRSRACCRARRSPTKRAPPRAGCWPKRRQRRPPKKRARA